MTPEQYAGIVNELWWNRAWTWVCVAMLCVWLGLKVATLAYTISTNRRMTAVLSPVRQLLTEVSALLDVVKGHFALNKRSAETTASVAAEAAKTLDETAVKVEHSVKMIQKIAEDGSSSASRLPALAVILPPPEPWVEGKSPDRRKADDELRGE